MDLYRVLYFLLLLWAGATRTCTKYKFLFPLWSGATRAVWDEEREGQQGHCCFQHYVHCRTVPKISKVATKVHPYTLYIHVHYIYNVVVLGVRFSMYIHVHVMYMYIYMYYVWLCSESVSVLQSECILSCVMHSLFVTAFGEVPFFSLNGIAFINLPPKSSHAPTISLKNCIQRTGCLCGVVFMCHPPTTYVIQD